MFFGLLRIREVLSDDCAKILTIKNIKFFPNIKNAQRFEITINRSKSSQSIPVIVNVGGIEQKHCPITILKEYLKRRCNVISHNYLHLGKNKVFVWANGLPISSDQFRSEFKKMIAMLGYDSNKFNTHSLRIGGATMLARCGAPESYIKAHSRWKSQIYMDYVRPTASELAKLSKVICGNVIDNYVIITSTRT